MLRKAWEGTEKQKCIPSATPHFLKNIKNMETKIGKAVYGLLDNTLFGFRVVSGIVTGISYSENTSPKYEITFGKNSVWVQKIAENKEDLIKLFNLADLKRVKETYNMELIYK